MDGIFRATRSFSNRLRLKRVLQLCCCCCCCTPPDQPADADETAPGDNPANDSCQLSSVSSQCNGHFCLSCRDILRRDCPEKSVSVATGVDSVEHFTWEERSAKHVGRFGSVFDPQCPLCQELARCQLPQRLEEHQRVSPETEYVFEKYLRSDEIGGYSLGIALSTAGSQRRRLVRVGLCPEADASANLGPFSSNTGSERSWKLVDEWMARCKLTHQICNPTPLEIPPLPTRVVDVGSVDDGTGPRVLIVTNETPPEHYATLSHCWGTHQPIKLLESNIAAFTQGIPEEELDNTFRDAISATRRLNLRYIWIDSLCIIQDSKEDWRQEASRMAQVYSNSYCNISAANATDGTEGCFSERDASSVCPVRIDVGWGSRPGNYFAVGSHAFPRNVLSAPLHRRAWVTQERFLAPRNIQCSATQLFWDCCELVASESFPLALPNGSELELRGFESSKVIVPEVEGRRMRVANGARPDTSLEAYAIWNRVVKKYSACNLTHAADKLVAISGLATKMQDFIRCQYLAGMWRRHLAYQLLWITLPGASYPDNGDYIAPSWSWASSPHPVLQASEVWFADEREIMVDIVDAEVDLLDQRHPFGQVTGGFLSLKGVLLKNTDKFALTPDEGTGDTNDPWLRINGLVLCRPRMDVADYEIGSRDLFYLPVRHASTQERFEISQPDVSGLVLEEVGNGRGTFRRVGQFEIHAGEYWFYHVGALEEFQRACWLANGETDEGPFPHWGARRSLMIV